MVSLDLVAYKCNEKGAYLKLCGPKAPAPSSRDIQQGDDRNSSGA